jgi:glycosyltransferase involved in cell wall biosynthesis
MESVWYKYEQIFTDNYSIVSPEYKEHLLNFTKEEYPNIDNEPYRRVWTKPISTYATNYNLFDVSLAPLSEHIFNKVKSQLKVIEAGFHKKALIAQDFGPYQIDMVNAYERGGTINPEGNGLLIPSTKNHKLWYQHIKRLILNPELVEQLSTNLFNDVKDIYSIQAITEKRREIYKSLVKKD